jgi:hypothetical protein
MIEVHDTVYYRGAYGLVIGSAYNEVYVQFEDRCEWIDRSELRER